MADPVVSPDLGRYARECWALGRRLARSARMPWLAGDVAGAALLGLAEALRGHAPGLGRLGPRVQFLATHRAMDLIRRERTERDRVARLPPVPDRDPGGPVGWELEYEDLVLALAALADRDAAEAFRLSYLRAEARDGLGLARRMGRSRGHCNAAKSRAHEQIRGAIRTRRGGPC